MNTELTPNFDPKNIVNSIRKAIDIGTTQSTLASQGVDWESVVGVLDEAEHLIGKEMSVNSHLNSVMFTDEFNKQYEKTLPLISNFYSDLGANKDLYKAFKRVNETTLNLQQKHIVNDSLRSFELSGVALDGAKSEQFKEIQEQLSVLSNQFSKNVLQSTNSWKKTVSAEELKGYGADEFSKVKTGDHYEINLQVPVYIDLMTYADSSDLREEVYKAYISRASDIGITSKEFDNRPIMDEILKLRLEMSELVGFSNYADYSTQSKMVDSPDAVVDFLSTLIELSTPQAKAELSDLERFAGHALMPWDLMY
ncbi:MAG: M3 family peptidase, partial [Thiotrichales bacterium]|nr:M3 family peptidase [Thiotrichales bacterium]